jgi:acetylcholinesterase
MFAEGGGGSTTAHVSQYLNLFMMPSAPQSHLDLLLQYYPDDPTVGCPFDTGLGNMLSTPTLVPSFTDFHIDPTWLGHQYKRIAAIQGDIVFHGPRRLLLKYQASKQNSWAFSMFSFSQLLLSLVLNSLQFTSAEKQQPSSEQ